MKNFIVLLFLGLIVSICAWGVSTPTERPEETKVDQYQIYGGRVG